MTESSEKPTPVPTQSEPASAHSYLGSLLKDRYLIEREIGRGGLGAVYLARDKQLVNRAVVIKVLIAEHGDERYGAWFQKKFKQEMEALARINHPGVVGVLDTGEMPDGKPFLAMQYVDGRTLRSVMITAGMDFERVANIARQMGQALTAAHEKGVYHRDLKPENIMLEDLGRGQEQVKLIDFGVARIKDSQVATDAEVTWIAGTPPYMAPEQLRGKPTAESDIYGFGAVVYEMLTGRPPYKAGSAVDLYELQREGAITLPKDLRKNLPEAAEAALMKALSFDAKDRYVSARDFAEDLAAALSGQARQVDPLAVTAPLSVTTASAEARPTSPDDTQLQQRHDQRNLTQQPSVSGETPTTGSFKRAAVVAVLLLLIAVAGWWFLNGRSSAPQTSTAVIPATAKPERAFGYWVMVQKYRDGKPFQSAFKLAGEINFENDYHVRLNVGSARPGFLYIVNEGPEATNGLPSYVTLFPSPTANNGSAQLLAGQHIAIPERGDGFVFDKDQGTEKLWLVWSTRSLPELEALKSLANPKDSGLLRDPAQIQTVRDLLAKHRAAQLPVIEKDDAEKQTNVLGGGDVMIHLINLEHH